MLYCGSSNDNICIWNILNKYDSVNIIIYFFNLIYCQMDKRHKNIWWKYTKIDLLSFILLNYIRKAKNIIIWNVSHWNFGNILSYVVLCLIWAQYIGRPNTISDFVVNRVHRRPHCCSCIFEIIKYLASVRCYKRLHMETYIFVFSRVWNI